MPRRAAGGNRARIEAALSPSLRAALRELRTLFGLGAHWEDSPLGPPFEFAAAILRAGELVAAGMAPTAALDKAAGELGLSHDTIRSRARRWSK
jgi:hypothetical protein